MEKQPDRLKAVWERRERLRGNMDMYLCEFNRSETSNSLTAMELLERDRSERFALKTGWRLTSGCSFRLRLGVAQHLRQPHHLAVADQCIGIETTGLKGNKFCVNRTDTVRHVKILRNFLGPVKNGNVFTLSRKSK